MSRKVLFVATVLRMHVLVFHLPYMRWFQEQGYEVHLCCANDTPDPHPQVPYCDRWVELPFSRSPFSADNREVFRRLKQLIDAEDYALIHCNTPVGGLLGRLAARAARKRGTRVVYTAHGFHFFTGAPLKLAAVLPRGASAQPLDRPSHHHQRRGLCPREAVCRRPRGAGQRRGGGPCALPRAGGPCRGACWAGYRPGGRRAHHRGRAQRAKEPRNRDRRRRAHRGGACGVLRRGGPAGRAGKCRPGTLGMEGRVHFLGFRRTYPALLAAAEVTQCFLSLQEGLPVAQMEAMAAGLPCVVSDVRGNNDLIAPGEGGFLRAAARRARVYAGYRAPAGGPGPARAHGRAQPPRDAPLQPGGGALPR